MRPTSLARALVFCLLVLGMAGAASGQDKPDVLVESEDLGDGFRAVSVKGGPPAIIDDQTGLIFKTIKGRPAIVDPEAGAILFMNAEGQGVVKYYGAQGAKGAEGAEGGQKLDAKKLERMKAFMKRVKEHTTPSKDGEKRAGEQVGGKSPARTLELRLAFCLQLIAVSGEETLVIEPLLRAILVKQDQIRRSTLEPGSKPPRSDDLPPVIQGFLAALRETVPGPLDPKGRKTPDSDGRVEKGLAAYRAARLKQGKELSALRGKLREALTVLQEAKLTGVGVLD